MTCRRDRSEPCLNRTRPFSPTLDSTRNKIAPACASFSSWATLAFPVFHSTISSNMCCVKSASIWPLETMSLNNIMNNSTPRWERIKMMKVSRRRRSCRPLHGDQEDGHLLRLCTMSRLSRHKPRALDGCPERRHLNYKTNGNRCLRRRKGVCLRTQFGNRIAQHAVYHTKAGIRSGMG